MAWKPRRTMAELSPRGAVVAIVAICVAGLVAVPLVLNIIEPPPTGFSSNPVEFLAFATHIDHVVFLVMENHAFDNYFGAYCPTVGPYCSSPDDVLPSATCVPFIVSDPAAGCIRPYAYTKDNWTLGGDLPHTYASSTKAWNQGAMNGFFDAERSNLTPFGYYDGATAPIYYDIAQQYALGDYFFSSELTYSLPNHWHIVAGQTPEQVILNGTTWVKNASTTIASDERYLNEANDTPSIADSLVHSTVSWKYYDWSLGTNYSNSTTLKPGARYGIGYFGGAWDYWNPLAAKAESYTAPFTPHFVSNVNFFTDASLGQLPQVSWLIPPGQDSDHPPFNSTTAQGYVASVVDAVESSPDWSSTALFISWDDYGGFYDHVPPPQAPDGYQLGFRVPLLVVSPYTPRGLISPSFGYFESILHLMEWRFGLPCLTSLDCTAPLPLSYFNFDQAPRAPLLFPTNVSGAVYPMTGPGTATPAALAAFHVPEAYTVYPGGEAPDVD